MTTSPEKTTGQPLLPFNESELLRVKILPSEFARSLNVHKSTVSRWLKNGTIAAGADGRIDPQRAVRQLLRNGDPGRFRSRLIRQAFGDLSDLRAQADRAADLERQLLDLGIQGRAEREAADADYVRINDWLDEFERRVGAITQETRGMLDDLAWRSLIKTTLLAVMEADSTFSDLDQLLSAELRQVPARAADEVEVGGAA